MAIYHSASKTIKRKMEDMWGLYKRKQNLLKELFPVLRIDQLVDATAGHELLTFMDANYCYNKIKMHVPNQEYTSFITKQGMYCYRVMSFDLKNAGANYQWMVKKYLPTSSCNMEVYVNDMLVNNKRQARTWPTSLKRSEFHVNIKLNSFQLNVRLEFLPKVTWFHGQSPWNWGMPLEDLRCSWYRSSE